MKKLLILSVAMIFSCTFFSISVAGQKYRYDRSKESANTEWMNESGTGKVNPRTGEYYSPAQPGYVGTRDGTYYAPAGPSGVINTRTGEFIPTN